MNPRLQSLLGFASLGFFFGFALFLVALIVGVRRQLLAAKDPQSAAILLALLLVPAFIGALVGWTRGARAVPSA